VAGHENITRDQAQQRAALLNVESYQVELDLTQPGDHFRTTTTVQFSCRTPGSTTWLDLIAPAVHSVQLNGTELQVSEVVHGARIQLPGLAADNTVVVVADGAYMNTGEGLHRFIDPVDDETYLYTQFESADARRMYACFEQPDLKATFQLTVTAPDHWKVISNAATPAPVGVGDGIARWTFAPTARISTYITALVAGPYHEVRDEYQGPHGTYPLGVFCRASLAEYLDADDVLLITKQGFAFFEEQFQTPYPFGKYDQLFVPEFNAGAMENAACVTFHEDMVFRSRVTDAAYEQRANTILHELAHMWFGDLVTMTWWDDLWLNESFAEWAAHYANVRATRFREAWTTFSNQRKAWAYRQDQLPSTHPIAADMVDLDSVRVNFDGITYAKGASALRQLVAWVGEEEFLAGLRTYFTTHAWGNTQLTDLLSELEITSGRDLSTWTEQWLQTSGVNLLRPIVEIAPDGTYARVAVQQEPPSAPPGLPPVLRSHRIGIGLYDIDDAGLSLRERIEVDVTGALTEIPELTGQRRGDMLLLNDGDLTFAKVRLDVDSWQAAITRIGDLHDSLARAIIWGAAWDMTRDGEVSTGDYLALVLSGLPRESEIAVVQMVLRQVRMAIDQFAAPEHRDAYSERLAGAMLDLARQAQHGSDSQLAFTRAFALSASSAEHLDIVQGLLDGVLTWPGLAVDTDLRWFLLQRLIAHGRLGEDRIDAELATDDTATGRRQAAVARAAQPTIQAKEQAWADIVERTDLPNALIEAAMAGFPQPNQREVLSAFRERYFADLPGIWSERTMEMAQEITVGLYPFLLADDETVRLTDAYLDGERQAAERRLVIEGRDGVQRAIRAQAADR